MEVTNMRKTTSIIILLLLICMTSVFAASNGNNNGDHTPDRIQAQDWDATEEYLQVRTREQIREMNNLSDNAISEMVRNELHKMLESNTTGLQNAIVHVENEQARERLQRNLERFQEKYQYVYEKYDAVEIDNNTYVKALRKAKFFGFEFDINDEYLINENGQVVNENRGFWSKIFNRVRYDSE